MKVYTHPVKIAAGAMLGKAIMEEKSGEAPSIDESHIEWTGDTGLLGLIGEVENPLPRQIATRLLEHDLYKPAFRATVLPPHDRTEKSYDARIMQFQQRGLVTPKGRFDAESKLAKDTRADARDVIVYCVARAPGLQKVRQYVALRPGDAELRDEVHKPHRRIVERHLGLWTVYVLYGGKDSSVANRLGEAGQELFGLKNEARIDRRHTVFLT